MKQEKRRQEVDIKVGSAIRIKDILIFLLGFYSLALIILKFLAFFRTWWAGSYGILYLLIPTIWLMPVAAYLFDSLFRHHSLCYKTPEYHQRIEKKIKGKADKIEMVLAWYSVWYFILYMLISAIVTSSPQGKIGVIVTVLPSIIYLIFSLRHSFYSRYKIDSEKNKDKEKDFRR